MEQALFVWLLFVLFLVKDQCVPLQMFTNDQTNRKCGTHLRSTESCPIIWPVSFG